MQPTDKHIAEIAGWLECGMICYFHRPTGTIEELPDIDDPYLEDEHRQDVQEIIDKIEKDLDNYIRFDKMRVKSTKWWRILPSLLMTLFLKHDF